MADETETGGTGPRIENEEQFKQWLEETRPAPDVCVALAARAALRALPFIVYTKTRNGRLSGNAIYNAAPILFRAMAASWTTAKHPAKLPTFFKFYYIAATNHAIKEATSSDIINSHLFWAAFHAVKAADAIYPDSFYPNTLDNSFRLDDSNLSGDERSISEIYNETYNAVYSAIQSIESSHSFIPASDHEFRTVADEKNRQSDLYSRAAKEFPIKITEFEFWHAIESDARLVVSGVSAPRLADATLWHNRLPILVRKNWGALKDFLTDTDGWKVWKNWYEDILNGKAHSEAHDLIYATVPVEEWDKGPAAANKWIAERLAELEKNTSSSDINLDDFPKPLDNIPSLFTFGLNDAGQIDVVAGPQNTPVIGFAGDEKTHRQWLETARELARRLADDLRDNKFGNVRRDYAEGLLRYAGDLPIEVGEGNFLLADHEIIAIHDLFGAEAAILPEALAARLNRVLKAHYSLLDFYPETKRYHEAAQKGRLSPPAPEEAFAGFEKVLREFTPEIFAPRVTQEIEAANYEAPRVEIDEEDRKLHNVIEPAKYPYEHDHLQERRYSIASLANALSKALWSLAKDPEKAIAYGLLLDKLSPEWSVIKQYLVALLN